MIDDPLCTGRGLDARTRGRSPVFDSPRKRALGLNGFTSTLDPALAHPTSPLANGFVRRLSVAWPNLLDGRVSTPRRPSGAQVPMPGEG